MSKPTGLAGEAEAILHGMTQRNADEEFRKLQAVAVRAAGTDAEEAVRAYVRAGVLRLDAWGYDTGSYR